MSIFEMSPAQYDPAGVASLALACDQAREALEASQ